MRYIGDGEMTYAPRVWVLLLTLTQWSAQSAATPLDIGEVDAKALSMAGAHTAAVTDYRATFYNPAALTQSRQTETGFGLMVTVPRLSIQLQKASVADTHAPLLPETRTALTIGANFPLGERIGNRFALGILLYSPLDAAIRGEMFSPQAPQFYRYQNRPDRFVALTALGYRISERLSIGIGVQLFADLLGRVQVDLRIADRHITQRAAQVDFPTKFSPTAGVLYTPIPPLKFGLSWKKGASLNFYIPSKLVLDDLAILNFNVGGVVLYTPDSLHFGGTYAWLDGQASLSIDASWYRWSTAPDPSLGISVDADGDVLMGLGIEDRLDLEGPNDIDLALRDVVILKVGTELSLNDQWSVRGGYSFRPAPAPIPTGAYNYLDPSSHRVSTGLGFTAQLGSKPRSRWLHVDLGYALTILPETSVTKLGGEKDPVGAYTAGGMMHGIALSVRHAL